MSDAREDWMQKREGGVLLRVLVQPKAARSEVIGVIEGATGEPARLKLRIAAPPVDGEANEEVLRFLKKALKITGARFTLESGQTSRQKDVFCEGVSTEQLRKLFK